LPQKLHDIGFCCGSNRDLFQLTFVNDMAMAADPVTASANCSKAEAGYTK
jgi:hypothetical protein